MPARFSTMHLLSRILKPPTRARQARLDLEFLESRLPPAVVSFSVARYSQQQAADPYTSHRGNGVLTSGANVTGNNPSDAYVPNSPAVEQAWIQHLISTFGSAQNGGVQFYALGNEPGLWNSTHRDIPLNAATLPELRDRLTRSAPTVNAPDPGRRLRGPEGWRW